MKQLLSGLIFLSFLSVYAESPKTGSYTLSGLKEFSPIGHKEFAIRMGWGAPGGDIFYKMEEQKFEVFVPDNYTNEKPYGLIVWVNSGDNGRMNGKYKEILKKHRIIWIGANMSGNKIDTRIRAQLAVDGRHNMMKLYNIDPNRVYVSGTSGGGKVACLAAFTFPELFNGGIFCIGVAHWVNISAGNGSFIPSKFQAKIPSSRMKIIANEGRYACMTGDKDFNRDHIKRTYDQLFSQTMKNCKYYQVPGLGHSAIPPDWYEKAIIQLDEPLAAIAKAYLTKGQQLVKSKKYIEAIKYLQMALSNDVEGAQAELDTLKVKIDEYTTQANDFLKAESFVKAFQLYKKIAENYGPFAATATEEFKKFNEDEKTKAELVADSYLLKAEYYFKKKDRINFKKYLGAIMKNYPDTKGAAKAKARWQKKKE
jgi:tetratricopeptide (TPR) repeat protein